MSETKKRLRPRHLQIQLGHTIPSITHALAALVPLIWWSSLRGEYSPVLIIGAIIVGNLPDIDSTTSHIGQLVYPLAKRIEIRFGHRTITHGLGALAFIAALSFAIYALVSYSLSSISNLIGPWWWWPIFYASHLILDMLVGGATAVPLLWPLKHKFWFGLDIKAKSTGENIVFVILLVAAVVPLVINPTVLNPTRLLRQSTGSVEMALYDYRQWEATHDVELEIEGTWQTDNARRPISGRFLVHHVEGSTFHLVDDNDAAFTVGQFGNIDVYLTRAIAHRGQRRAQSQPTPTPTPTPGPSPTPQILAIQIDGITNPDTQILVHPGDHVRPGITLAIPPTPLPLPTPTPWSIDPLTLAQAEADWTIAQAQHALDTAWKPVEETTILYAQATILQIQAQIVDLEVRISEGKAHSTHGLEALKIRLAIAESNLAELEESNGTGPTWQQRQLANAKLQSARLVYSATIATATPAPSPTPIPNHTIDALVTGQVRNVYVSRVNPEDNTATVAIVIAVSSSCAEGACPESALSKAEGPSRRATVDHVVDGDTIDITWPTGATARVRLLGVDTPETVRPDRPTECYGPEASDYTKTLLPEGTQVSLQFDRQRLDPYGRTLAYVYLLDEDHDGQMLQSLLLENGYARVLIVEPNSQHAALFYSLEDQAKAEERGLWRACAE